MRFSNAICVVPAAVIALAGCSGGTSGGSAPVSAIPDDGVEIKLAGKAGDKDKVETLIAMDVVAPKGTPGVPPDGKMKVAMTLVGDYDLQSVKDGKITYRLKISEAKMEGNAPSNSAFAALKGKSGTLVFDEYGKLQKSSGELAQAEQMFSMAEFPKKKLKKGDTWEQTSLTGGVSVTLVNKLEGMEAVDGVNCFVVTNTVKENAVMKMATPGKMWINPATGRPVKATMAMTMDMGAQGKATMTMNLRKVS